MNVHQRAYQAQIESLEKDIEQKKAKIQKLRQQVKIETKATNGAILTPEEIKLMPREDHQRLLMVSMARKIKKANLN